MREDLRALKPGDRVQVFDVNGDRMRQPAGGWDGEVVKVGRTLIHVSCPPVFRGVKAFSLRDGRANDAYRHQWLMTPEEAAADLRYRGLSARLREHGVRLDLGVDLSVEKLAAVVAVLDGP